MLDKIIYRLKNISLVLIAWISVLYGAYLENIPANLQQPDATVLNCLLSGDEYYIRLHDENNYTIIQNVEDGYYYYAQLINNEVVPTIYKANKPVPPRVNFESGVQITAKILSILQDFYCKCYPKCKKFYSSSCPLFSEKIFLQKIIN